MGLGDTIPNGSDDDENNSSNIDKQRKSLVANTYSTKSKSDAGNIEDWNLSEELVRVAYGVTSPRNGSGAVKDFLNDIRKGGHEEFYSELQIAVAHAIANNRSVPEFDQFDIEPRGQSPLLELFYTSQTDCLTYMVEQLREAEGEERQEMAQSITDWAEDNEEAAETLAALLSGDSNEEAEPVAADD